MHDKDIGITAPHWLLINVLLFLLAASCLNAQDTLEAETRIKDSLDHQASFTIQGKVLDKDSSALPFVNLYIKGTSISTTTNQDGEFDLQLSTSDAVLMVQCIGFKTQTLSLMHTSGPLTIVMHGEHYELKAAEVSTQADQAYSIIKKAIAHRKEHLEMVKSYSCETYLKGVVRLTQIPKSLPFFIQKTDMPDSSDLGIIYLSESQSMLHVRYPHEIKEIMTASRVSGSSQAFSWNRASDIRLNFYENSVFFPFISKTPFVSPIASNALLYYKYKLEGAFVEDGQLVDKIKVTSRRISEPAFNGYIYIIEDSWQIHSLDLYLTRDANINFVDTLQIDIHYVPLSDRIRMPLSVKFHARYKAFGFGAEQTSIGLFSNYAINPTFAPRFFSNEVFKVNKEANTKDSSWWINHRPLLITEEESSNYRKNDSLELLKKSKPYLDSLDRINNRFRLVKAILTGYEYENSVRHWDLNLLPLISAIQANTIEGTTLNWSLTYGRYYDERRRSLNITPALRYGFNNHKLNARMRVSYASQKYPSYQFFAEGGKYVSQFNHQRPIAPLLNTLYTELLEENFIKLYQKNYAAIGFTREIINGLRLTLQSEYAHRQPLQNYSNAKPWIDYPNKEYTPNNPAMPEHNSWNIELLLRIRPFQQYSTVGDYKWNHRSRFPTCFLLYRKGLSGIAGSESNFDFIQVGLSYDFNIRLLGSTSIDFFGGMFANRSQVFFPDYKHFNGNQTLWFNRNQERRPMNNCFQLLPYYTYSTTSPFIQLHLEHDFGSFIMSKLPLIRRLHWENNGGINFLYTQGIREHVELYFGFSRIFKFFRLDVVNIYNRTSRYQPSIRFGLDL